MLSNRNGPLIIASILILPLIAALFVSGCSIKKPESPSWLTTWDVPIINRIYDIREILDKIDAENIVYDSLGNPGFQIIQDMDTVGVDSSLTFAGTSVDIRDSIGTLDIEPPTDINASANVNDFLNVSSGVVAPQYFSYNEPLPPIDRFSWVDVASGTIDLTFFNGLEVDLDTFVVTIIDESDLHTVGVATYVDGLDYLETETQSIDISGQRISNTLSIDFDGYTTGGVLINVGPQNADATVSFPGTVTVTAARAETPAINIGRTESTALTDSTMVVSSTIASGNIQFDIANYTQIPFTIDLVSDNLASGGNPLWVSRQVGAMGVTQVLIDLAGYSFSPVDSGGVQYVVVDLSASAPPSAPAQYTVSASDSIGVQAAISDITFESVTGRIGPTSVNVDPVQQDLDIPEGLDQARLTRAQLNVNIYNNSMVEADIDLSISGGGNVINVADRIAGKSSPGAAPMLTIVSVGGQELSDFLNPPPAQITVTGQALLNPDYVVTTVTSGDYFYGEVEIYSPFALAIADTIPVDLDISDTEIDPDSRPDNFQETFRYGAIDVAIENHLPLAVSMMLYIGTVGDSTIYGHPATLALGPYDLEAGVTDVDGHVVEPTISDIADSLDSSQLSIFDRDTVYFGQIIDLLPTDPAGVEILGSDYIGINARARMQVQLGDNVWGED
jgi:hypothetical protein